MKPEKIKGSNKQKKKRKFDNKPGERSINKLFQEEEFTEEETANPPKKKKDKKKTDDVEKHQFKKSTEDNTKKKFKLKKKKHLMVETEPPEDNKQFNKKKKKKGHVGLEVDAQKEQTEKKIKRKQKQSTSLDVEDLDDEEQVEVSTEANSPKKKKRKNMDVLDIQAGQRISPNATKFLFINLIKNTLQKKISLSQDKLCKKVMKKFYKLTGAQEKSEFLKIYEKSLKLTYGIKVSGNIVQLKQ